MTGSVLDGEDIVQEALFQAYRKLDTFDDARPLAPWLFRIAHNRCIDFLRRRGVREEAETAAMAPDFVLPADPAGPDLGRAVERLVIDAAAEGTRLRAAEGRVRLLARGDRRARRLDGRRREGRAQPRPAEAGVAPEDSEPPAPSSVGAMSQLLHLYVERFNRRDWDGLRELISADARLAGRDRFVGTADRIRRTSAATTTLTVEWRMAVGVVDGESGHRQPARATATGWTPRSLVRLDIVDQQVVGVGDYTPLSVDDSERRSPSRRIPGRRRSRNTGQEESTCRRKTRSRSRSPSRTERCSASSTR